MIAYRPAGCARLCAPRPLPALVATPWGEGPVVDRLRIADGELVLAGLVSLRRGVAPDDDWRFGRVRNNFV